MRILSIFTCIFLFVLLLTACGSKIDVEKAEEIALNYIQENNTETWYVSKTDNQNGNWVIHTKILGNDCIEKFLYINKKTGFTSIRGGNEC